MNLLFSENNKFKKESEELIKIKEMKGKTIGSGLKNHFEYILKREGKEGLEKIEKEMENLGFSLKYKELKSFEWYPEGSDDLILFLAKKIFKWDEDIFRESGRWGAKASLISRLMMKYFISIEKILEKISAYWNEYHTNGILEVKILDKKNKILIIELRDFNNTIPEHCRYLEGYFWQVSSYILPKKKLKVKEIKCPLLGNTSHQFEIVW